MVKKYSIYFFIFIVIYTVYYFFPYSVEALGYYDKIWAHRVNSIEKLESAIKYFEGVELDLVYNKDLNTFDVNHAPTKSIGLNFDTYINSIDDKKPFLWLDVKNLNEKNAQLILKRLLNIFGQLNYPLEKILIESRKPEKLEIFENQGFKTSYYLPYNLSKLNDSLQRKHVTSIEKILEEQPNLAISTSFKDYDFIVKEFPKKKKYIWAIVKPIHFNHFKIRKILKDANVEILLLKYNALQGNR